MPRVDLDVNELVQIRDALSVAFGPDIIRSQAERALMKKVDAAVSIKPKRLHRDNETKGYRATKLISQQ